MRVLALVLPALAALPLLLVGCADGPRPANNRASVAAPERSEQPAIWFRIRQEVTTHYRETISESAETTVEREEAEYVVTITPDMISLRRDRGEVIYDFLENQMVSIDHEKYEYDEVSLYSVLAFNDYEKVSRDRGYSAFINQDRSEELLGTRQFDLESLFGGDVNGEVGNEITRVLGENSTTLYYDGEEVTRFNLSELKLEEPHINTYRKYLLYVHSLHPAIVERLIEGGRLFNNLSYRTYQISPYLVERKLVMVDHGRHKRKSSYLSDAYAPKTNAENRLDRIIQQSRMKQPTGLDIQMSELQRLREAGQYMDANAILHKIWLQHGLPKAGRWRHEMQRLFDESPRDVRLLNAAITSPPESEDGLRPAIAIIDAARSRLGERGYVLNVYMANYHLALNEARIAEDLMLEALEQNPFLVSVYNDLGQVYFRAFQMPSAWVCWDRMREIGPNHEQVAAVNDLERQIRQAHPSYFN